MTFANKSSRYPLIRSALVATNLIAPANKVIEGKARLIVKSDIGSLASKNRLLEVDATEAVLAECWWATMALVSGGIAEVAAYKLFGRLSARLVLFLAKKQADGPERSSYKKLSDIKAKFIEEHDALVAGGAPASDTPSIVVAAKTTMKTMSLHDVSNATFAADNDGYVVGKLYIKRGGGVFKLMNMTDADVTFQLQSVLLDEGQTVTESVSYSLLNKTFSQYKGKLQTKLSSETIGRYIVDVHPLLNTDCERCAVFRVLTDVGKKHATCEALLAFYQSPAEVRAIEKIAVGALKLVPVTELSKITTFTSKGNGTNNTRIIGGTVPFTLEPPMRPTTTDHAAAQWGNHVIMAGYWWVQSTNDKSVANMRFASDKAGGFTIPIMQNTKILKKHDKLCYFTDATISKKAKTVS
jgi:hypothetical protein